MTTTMLNMIMMMIIKSLAVAKKRERDYTTKFSC